MKKLFNPIIKTINYKLFILRVFIKLITRYETTYDVKSLLIIKIIRAL